MGIGSWVSGFEYIGIGLRNSMYIIVKEEYLQLFSNLIANDSLEL